MICISCENKDYKVIYTETYPCAHCDEDLIIEYCMCGNCGLLWRGVNGEVIEDSLVHTEDLMNILNPFNQAININPEDLSEEDRKMLDGIEHELKKTDDAMTMSDMIHRCIKCNTIVHETKRGYYKCDNCDFSWEVVDFG